MGFANFTKPGIGKYKSIKTQSIKQIDKTIILNQNRGLETL